MAKLKKVLLVGDALIDRNYFSSPKGISPEAPIITWKVEWIEDLPGGAGNVFENLLSLGNHLGFLPYFAGPICEETRAILQYDDSVISLCNDRRSPCIKSRIITSSLSRQEVRFDYDTMMSLDLRDERNVIERIEENGPYEVGVISDYAHGGVTRNIVFAAQENCKITIVDPKQTDLTLYEGCNIITPNIAEINSLIPGDEPLEEKVAILRKRLKPTKVILKLGDNGCFVPKGKKMIHLEPLEVTSVDPIGAGDTFLAALAASLVKSRNLLSAAERANILAGLSVEFSSCYIPTEEHVREIFREDD